jgi:hypothetical protein
MTLERLEANRSPKTGDRINRVVSRTDTLGQCGFIMARGRELRPYRRLLMRRAV